jgi:hypothetical protein
MPTRTIKTPAEEDMVLFSDDLEEMHLVLAELELCHERGTNELKIDLNELVRRIAAKGYDPNTGNPIN